MAHAARRVALGGVTVGAERAPGFAPVPRLVLAMALGRREVRRRAGHYLRRQWIVCVLRRKKRSVDNLGCERGRDELDEET